MNVKFDKPFITYDDMINTLEQRNIIVADKSFALSALSNLSYYGLVNGYKNTFLSVAGSDNFVSGTKFEDLYTMNLLDCNLNSIILKYILYIEKSLKSKITYIVSMQHGVYTNVKDEFNSEREDYLNYKNYNSNKKSKSILRSLKKSITERENPIIDHYLYEKNHLPPWILSCNIPYGLAIEWFCILNPEEKQYVCDDFIQTNELSSDEKKEFIRKALFLTKEYRNKIAHGNRTISITNLPELPRKQISILTSKIFSKSEYISGMGRNDIFAVFLVLVILLNDNYLISNFMHDLFNTLQPYINYSFNGKSVFEVFNLPNDTFERLQKVLS